MTWRVLYRGSLSSCNYACGYCPFAKTRSTREGLARDRRELERFTGWVAGRSERLGLLFTPWGEALGHRHYRRALVRLSHLPHVERVAIQTNLAAPLGELAEADPETLALWTTFHPSQTSRERFLARCAELDRRGLRYSVGMVGLREHLEEIEELRRRLPAEVYLWVNAFKRDPAYYRPGDVQRLLAVDPHLGWNLRPHPSAGRPCRTGEAVFAVDGRGDVRRCHFVPEVLGNLYEGGFPECLGPRPCPRASCGCHIGYVHMPGLGLDRLYGEGILERIPSARNPGTCVEGPASSRTLRTGRSMGAGGGSGKESVR